MKLEKNLNFFIKSDITNMIEPICLTGILPENPKVKDIHNDFYFFAKKEDKVLLGKRAISQSELDQITKFWNLTLTDTKNFIGEIPYYNQLEIVHFLESNPTLDASKIKIISTSDQILDIESLENEYLELNRKIENKFEKVKEIERKLFILEDPIVVYPYLGLWVVVTAWGAEEKALWHLPSLS